jgi:metal-sulfur cluster biosynthetic enzyme
MEPNEQELQEPTAGRAAPSDGSAATGNGGPEGLVDQVMDALRKVNDPELGINIVDLGLVYDVRIEGGTVHVDYTLTTMGCPIGPLIEDQIRQMLEPVEGVDQVEAEMTLSPPWTPDKMSEEAKAALGFF